MPSANPVNPTRPYFVGLYGSDPSTYPKNDDCWTGEEYATLAEARYDFDNWFTAFKNTSGTAFVQIDGPDVSEVKQVLTDSEIDRRKRAVLREEQAEGRAWQREIANEAGMLGGCDAYNEAMGY
jgi:hypothetical protein